EISNNEKLKRKQRAPAASDEKNVESHHSQNGGYTHSFLVGGGKYDQEKEELLQMVSATDEQIRTFLNLSLRFVKFYRKWEAENNRRATLAEKLPFLELLDVFRQMARDNYEESPRIKNFTS